jgi:hypothetical protein
MAHTVDTSLLKSIGYDQDDWPHLRNLREKWSRTETRYHGR